LTLTCTLAVPAAEAIALPDRMLVEEDFQTDAGTTPVRGFRAYGGPWQVKDGLLYGGPGAGPKLVCEEAPLARGEVGVELLLPDKGGGNAGFIVKVSEAGEGADRFHGYEISLDASGQYLRLGRHRQNFEAIKDVPCPVPVDQWIPLVVRMTERTLEILVSGQIVLTYEDTAHPLASGAVGFRPWQREARFRNFWIRRDGQTKHMAFAPPAEDDEPTVSTGWHALRRGSTRGQFAIRSPHDATRRRAQRMAFVEGQGEVGIEHRGRDGQGLAWARGRPYQGTLWVRSEQATDLFVAAETATGQVLSETRLAVAGGQRTPAVPPGVWQTLRFALTPDRDDLAGTLAIKLSAPGAVDLGRVLCEPGDWAWPPTLATGNLPPVALVTRHPLSAPPAVGQDIWAAQPRAPGCSIRVLEPSRSDQPVRTVFSDPEGCIYDLNVSYDARTLLFSYRPKAEPYWHIWRINADGTGLRQLTDGPHYDISPCPLPDGRLVFVSTRRFGYTLCQPGPASGLHVMAADGRDIHCVSMNTLSDMSPQILPDGRVLFTRWEYVDRDLTFRQSLWTQYPDGTVYQLYFGNTVRDVGTFWQARPLPGHSDRVVATFAPHHGFPHGAIGLIDRSFGPEGPKGAGYTYITREFPSIGDARHEWAYRDPFPLSERSFLCAYGGGGSQRYRIYLLDVEDRRRLVYEDLEQGCYFPIPLQPTPVPPELASQTQAERTQRGRLASGTGNSRPDPDLPASSTAPGEGQLGTFLLADVYRGLEPVVARGRVKYLRVMEQVRKTEDLRSRAYDQSPVMSYGTYYAKRCWGTVSVEEDGSACFLAPALREIYFQALDAEGRELQRMTSAVQVMPGERVSCVGCHEPRQIAPPNTGRVPLAAGRPPRTLEPLAGVPDGIVDFPKTVQPVLDRHCVKCHNGSRPDGGYDLTGDKTRYFSMAYDNLLGRSRSYRQHDMETGEMLAAERAKGQPLVHFYWLLRTPTAVNQPLWTGCHASRLLVYVDTAHCGEQIPLADRQRIYLWIDANVPYYGTYAHSRPLSPGRRDLCTDVATGQLSAWFAQDFLGVYNRRCAACHGNLDSTTDWEGRFAWINFSRPQLSAALTAHLRKSAGGRGIDQPVNGQSPPRFDTTADPDYQTMLQAIETGRRLALATPEADMPGFRGARKEP
jgi:mono/diheme cytochrome c family protein